MSPKPAAVATSPAQNGDKDPASLYQSEEPHGVDGSVQRRMESIPEEDASKANLHSSHSKVGPNMH